MKIVQINTFCGVGSTGKICYFISNLLNERGIENYILYTSMTNGYKQGIACSNPKKIKIEALKSRIFGNYGLNGKKATFSMIRELDKIVPDIVHLHNIHTHDCHLKILFEYLKKKKIKVYWTFHDCWAFTGYCPYFSLDKCNKWKVGCNKCESYKSYSWFLNRSSYLYNMKKNAIKGINLTIITPSQWLANLVNQSFLNEYPIHVINNGIDLNVFKPTYGDFKKKYSVENKKILLCVANVWEKRKGLDVLVNLACSMPEEYQMVLVGTNDYIDKILPKNIISIHKTINQQKLAEIYTAADVFINPSREDNYPTVNLESIACGTPVVTFRTGGSPETIIEGINGYVIDFDDVEGIKKAIIKICTSEASMEQGCLSSARRFDMNKRFQEYVELYKSFYDKKKSM